MGAYMGSTKMESSGKDLGLSLVRMFGDSFVFFSPFITSFFFRRFFVVPKS